MRKVNWKYVGMGACHFIVWSLVVGACLVFWVAIVKLLGW
jgi:hypothetical protein